MPSDEPDHTVKAALREPEGVLSSSPAEWRFVAEAGVPRVVGTKLSVPTAGTRTIARDRLTRLLDAAGECPLTVVCAPAGFGKTTALVGWFNDRDGPGVWLSLDAQDNDPRRLCGHLLAGLDRVWPRAMVEAETALLGGSDLVETVAPAIVGVLEDRADADDARLAIVLDDYHLVSEPECHALLLALTDALPAGRRVVVSSRTMPPLRLARRGVAGTLHEIGPEELAFQGGEAELLLNRALGLNLAAEQIAAIDERVDGWPAGLALVAASLTAKPARDDFLEAFARSDAAVAMYLIEEVLDATDPRVREFLCQTSVLSRLSAPLSIAVLEDPGAGELLAEVRRSNLFVTALDGEWVCYHDLFAELLRRELRTRSPELIPHLHQRASAWFAVNGPPEDAIRHASAAGDGEHAASLLYEHWRTLFDEPRYASVRQLVEQLPSDRGQWGPFCEALDTVCMSLEAVDLRIIAQRLDALDAERDAPGVGEIVDFSRVSPYYGDVGRAVKYGWIAWERHDDPFRRAQLAGLFGSVLWFAGNHAAVRQVVEPYLTLIKHHKPRSWALASLALTAADEGDIDHAERYARDAVEICVANGGATALECHYAYVAHSEALRLRGALNQAAQQLAIAARLTAKVPGSVYQAFTLIFQAQLELTARNRRRARTHAEQARRIIDSYPDSGVLANRLTSIETTLTHRRATTPGSQPTQAEQRVLALLARDLTHRQIADELHLTIPTVRSHIQRLYRRLGVHSRDEAITAARQRALLQG